jgi:hypothetical protein
LDYQSIVQWKVGSLEPKSPTANVVGFTMIYVIPHDDFSCLYWIAKFHNNLNRGNTTTGAYSFSRQQCDFCQRRNAIILEKVYSRSSLIHDRLLSITIKFLTILKITALLMIFLSIFIHSYDEWSLSWSSVSMTYR